MGDNGVVPRPVKVCPGHAAVEIRVGEKQRYDFPVQNVLRITGRQRTTGLPSGRCEDEGQDGVDFI